jgi:hypothetical protein
MAACDAQHLGEVLAPIVARGAANENAPAADSSARPSATAASEGDGVIPSQGVPPLAQSSGADERHVPVLDQDTAVRCSNHVHVGGPLHQAAGDATHPPATTATPPTREATPSLQQSAPHTCNRPLPRARQAIPPALRRAVLQRDRHCCQVPGCTHATYVDVHHIQRRADGGLNVIENLLTICSVHHRAAHHGQLLIERGLEGPLVFRHADGRLYGDPASAPRVDVQTKVFSALRHLGFRESEIKAVLAELRADATLADAPTERLLREALCRIEPRAR